jgi:hypothetical protein
MRRPPVRFASIALFTALAALGSGCGAVLGLGDFTDEDGGASGQGGASSQGGASHAGGTSHTGGGTTSTHAGGAGGAGGSGGTTGTLECAPDEADCDHDGVTCEAKLTKDPQNCGACGTRCSSQGVLAPVCKNGKCFLDCDSSHADCDGQVDDGCEQDISGDMNNCGGCGKRCSSDHGTAACSGGVCQLACAKGWGDCDGDGSNGCEKDLSSHVTDCGACGSVCGSQNTDAVACVDGSCQLTCTKGFADCNSGAPGCETNIFEDVHNCGACNALCSNAHAMTATCHLGLCNLTCQGTYSDCDGDKSNGCEAELQTDPKNCGKCGHVCEGDCKYSCLPVTLSTQLNHPAEVVVTQGAAYVASPQAIVKVPLDGSMPFGIGNIPAQNVPQFLAYDSKNLYFFDAASSAIDYVALPDGGSVKLLVSNQVPTAIVADDNGVYWSDSTTASIRRFDASQPGFSVAVVPEYAGHLAMTATTLVWATVADGKIRTAPRAGGAAKTIWTPGADLPTHLVVHGTTLFFSTFNASNSSTAVHSINVDGTGYAMLQLLQYSPTGMAVSDKYVFFATGAQGELDRIAANGGGGVSLLEQNLGMMGGIAVDAKHVYWTIGGVGDGTGKLTKLDQESYAP